MQDNQDGAANLPAPPASFATRFPLLPALGWPVAVGSVVLLYLGLRDSSVRSFSGRVALIPGALMIMVIIMVITMVIPAILLVTMVNSRRAQAIGTVVLTAVGVVASILMNGSDDAQAGLALLYIPMIGIPTVLVLALVEWGLSRQPQAK